MNPRTDNLPPRDPRGRFISRTDISSSVPGALPPSSPPPNSSTTFVHHPPDLSSDSTDIPFATLVARASDTLQTPTLGQPSSQQMPPTAPPEPPLTPTRLPVSPWVDSEPPLPPPKFDQLPADGETPTSTASPVEAHQTNRISTISTPALQPTSQPHHARFPPPPASLFSPPDISPPLPPPPSALLPTAPLIQPPSSPPALPLVPLSALPPPTLVTPMPAMAHSFGPAGMPSHRSQTAPYFSGNVEDSWEDFIKEYEDLARGCRLTDQEKCETLLRYIASSHRDLCRSLDEYSNSDLTGFRQALSHIYESPSMEGKYSQQKLSDFVKLASKTRKKEEEDVRQYYRKFLILSKPLLDSHELTKQE